MKIECQYLLCVTLLWLYMSTAHHCQLLECLMTNKKNVVKDLLCVIAYGTSGARASAAKLLFYYWPTFNPNLFDRRVVLQKFTSMYCQELYHSLPFIWLQTGGKGGGKNM